MIELLKSCKRHVILSPEGGERYEDQKKPDRNYRLFALFLICAVFTSVALPANAAEFQKPTYSRSAATFATSQESGLPFTFEPGTKVTSLWTTNRNSGGYNFVPGKVGGTTIKITGSFEHSLSSGQAKASVCYYSGGTYYAAISSTKTVGNSFDGSGLKSALDQDRTYYGGIKSVSTSGYVYDAMVTISAA